MRCRRTYVLIKLTYLLIDISMYILASDLFQKEDKYYLRLEICVVWGEFKALKIIFTVIFKTNLMIIIFVHQNLSTSRLKPGFRYSISI